MQKGSRCTAATLWGAGRFGSVAFGTARAQGQSNLSTRAGKYCESCSKASPHGEVFAETRHLSHGERVALFNR